MNHLPLTPQLVGPVVGAIAVGLVGACASMQAPPGGPPDPDPPVLLAITPDSGAVLPDFDDDVEFRFDEVITERNIEQLVTVSPRHEEIRVSWKRRGLAVRPRDGWHSNVVYIVSVLPGVTDLRNNRSDSTHTVVFSTGGPIPDTRLFGSVVNWEDGRVATGALIEAILLPDSLTYIGTTDSLGDFELAFLPNGIYHVRASIDANNNQTLDAREAYDSATVQFGGSFSVQDFWTFRHDTLGPSVTAVSQLDSQAISVRFNQAVDSNSLSVDAFRVLQLPDSTATSIDRVLLRSVYDSLQAEAREAARIAAEDSTAAALQDSLAALGVDSAAVADTAVAPEPPAIDTIVPPEAQPDTTDIAVPDSTRAMYMLAERPALISDVVLMMVDPLQPGTRYWVDGNVSNLLGALLQSGRFLVLPEAVEPDST